MTLNNPLSKLRVIELIEMECDMTLYDELPYELHLKEIREEINTLCLQREAVIGKPPYDKRAALIGRWMIFPRNKLGQRQSNAGHNSFLVTRQKS